MFVLVLSLILFLMYNMLFGFLLFCSRLVLFVSGSYGTSERTSCMCRRLLDLERMVFLIFFFFFENLYFFFKIAVSG